MIKATIKAIGKHAISEEPLLILFGETATPALREHAIIQEIASAETFDIQKAQTLHIGTQEYTVAFVGELVNKNLNELHHVTLVFAPVPAEDIIMNGIYLTPYQLPKLEVDDTIVY